MYIMNSLLFLKVRTNILYAKHFSLHFNILNTLKRYNPCDRHNHINASVDTVCIMAYWTELQGS